MSALIATWPLAARRVPRLQWVAVVLITLAIWGNFGTLVALSSAVLLIFAMTIPHTLLLWQKGRKDSRGSVHAEPPRREGVIRPFAPAEPGVPEKAAKVARGTVNLARSRSTELARDLKKLMLLPMVLYNFVQHIDWSRLRGFVDTRIVPSLNKLDEFLEGRERALYATPDSTPTTPKEGAMNDNDGREDTPVNEDRLAVLEGIRRLRLRNTGFDSDGTAYAPDSAAARMARYGAGTDVIDPDPYDQALNLASGGGSDAAIDYDFAAPPIAQVPRTRSDLDTLFDGTDDDVVSTGSWPVEGSSQAARNAAEARESDDTGELPKQSGGDDDDDDFRFRRSKLMWGAPAASLVGSALMLVTVVTSEGLLRYFMSSLVILLTLVPFSAGIYRLINAARGHSVKEVLPWVLSNARSRTSTAVLIVAGIAIPVLVGILVYLSSIGLFNPHIITSVAAWLWGVVTAILSFVFSSLMNFLWTMIFIGALKTGWTALDWRINPIILEGRLVEHDRGVVFNDERALLANKITDIGFEPLIRMFPWVGILTLKNPEQKQVLEDISWFPREMTEPMRSWIERQN